MAVRQRRINADGYDGAGHQQYAGVHAHGDIRLMASWTATIGCAGFQQCDADKLGEQGKRTPSGRYPLGLLAAGVTAYGKQFI